MKWRWCSDPRSRAPAAPREIAVWVSGEAGGLHSDTGYAYWYNGRVYAANGAPSPALPGIGRGFDVFEADAGLVGGAGTLPYLNPQTQGESIYAIATGRSIAVSGMNRRSTRTRIT